MGRRSKYKSIPTTTPPFARISALSLLWLPLEVNHAVARPLQPRRRPFPPPPPPPALPSSAIAPLLRLLLLPFEFSRVVAGGEAEPGAGAGTGKIGRPASARESYGRRVVVQGAVRCRCYEVGVNKTATVATIANLLRVFF